MTEELNNHDTFKMKFKGVKDENYLIRSRKSNETSHCTILLLLLLLLLLLWFFNALG